MNKILITKNLNADLMKNHIAAINTGAFALGSIIGPIMGSALYGYFGYRLAFLIFTFEVIICFLLKFYALTCYRDKEGE
jgi:MFS family permease